jgi:hypothetical protein
MSEDMNEHTPRWTPDKVEALAKEFMDAAKTLADRMELRPEQLAGQFYKYDAASALTWALERIAKVEKDLSEGSPSFEVGKLPEPLSGEIGLKG